MDMGYLAAWIPNIQGSVFLDIVGFYMLSY